MFILGLIIGASGGSILTLMILSIDWPKKSEGVWLKEPDYHKCNLPDKIEAHIGKEWLCKKCGKSWRLVYKYISIPPSFVFSSYDYHWVQFDFNKEYLTSK